MNLLRPRVAQKARGLEMRQTKSPPRTGPGLAGSEAGGGGRGVVGREGRGVDLTTYR